MRIEGKPEFLIRRIQTNNNPLAAFCHVVYSQYYHKCKTVTAHAYGTAGENIYDIYSFLY